MNNNPDILLDKMKLILQKYEVYNENLALDLAIFVLEHEKDVIKESHEQHQEAFDRVFNKFQEVS